ncbi:hypothetical protein H4S02_013525 [Coemansia sp. RSA 2611]|nr:hypothetical protein H4S02_013525 [Coemansia sp. RSA 2611]
MLAAFRIVGRPPAFPPTSAELTHISDSPPKSSLRYRRRKRSHRRRRTKPWAEWRPCHVAAVEKREAYCHPSSSTSWVMSMSQRGDTQCHEGSGN